MVISDFRQIARGGCSVGWLMEKGVGPSHVGVGHIIGRVAALYAHAAGAAGNGGLEYHENNTKIEREGIQTKKEKVDTSV